MLVTKNFFLEKSWKDLTCPLFVLALSKSVLDVVMASSKSVLDVVMEISI